MSINSISGLAQQQFLQLFIAQLQNQNPLQPLSDSDMINQLTQINTMGSLSQLNASFADMLALQQLTQGSDLIGKSVTYAVDGSNETRTGVVNALAVQNGSVVLRIDNNDSVSLKNVQTVQLAP